MQATPTTEVWLRGPLSDVPILLNPVAHALLQAREEIINLMTDFDDELLWQKPAGLASPGFHLRHLAGVIDRLLTYARAEALNSEQLTYLSTEGQPTAEFTTSKNMVRHFATTVDNALLQLMQTDVNQLTEVRGVGRSQIPSTVVGLYTHAAEHTMRHLGQLLVTVKVLQNQSL